MKKNSRTNKTINSIAIGVICGLSSFLLLLLLFAIIITKYDIPHNSFRYFYVIAAIISGIITGGTTGKISASRGIIWASISSVIVPVIIFIFLFIFNNFNLSSFTLLIFPIFIATGAISGVIFSNLR